MNAELIAVGTELLLGDTINTDAAAVARLLSELGINVYWQTVVGDNRARLEQAVQLARTRADLIITTGGLGPTCDDLTKEVVAGAFGIPLELNKAEEERLRGLYRERHTYMTENHLQQVMLPRGCTVLQNDWGTAPACAFEADGCLVIMLPGPPLECEPLLRYRVRPFLAARGDGIIVSHSVKIFGIGEGTMEYQLRDLMNEMQNPTLAPYAKEGECLVRVTAKAATEAEAETMIAPCLARVQRELGAFAYGVDTPNIETCAAELLLAQHKTIAVADSCTGGLLGDLLTNVPGASAVLAEHVRAAFGTDLGLSITGLAGPDGDGVHTVGTLFVALATPDGTFHRTLHKDKWGRVRIKHAAANHAFDMLRRYLTSLPVEMEENR